MGSFLGERHCQDWTSKRLAALRFDGAEFRTSCRTAKVLASGYVMFISFPQKAGFGSVGWVLTSN